MPNREPRHLVVPRTLPLVGLLCALLIACGDDKGSDSSTCEGESCTADAGGSGRGRRDPGDTGAGEIGGDDTGASEVGTDGAGEDLALGDATIDEGDGGSTSRGGAIRPDPESIFLGASGAAQEQIIRVYNETDQIVTFTSAVIESDAAGFSLIQAPVDVVREPGGIIGFKMRYDPASAADVSATIRVYHTFGDPVVIPVTIAAKVEDNGCIAVNPTSVNFGTVMRGAPLASRTVTVSNCGSAQINVLRLNRGRVLFLPTPTSFQWTTVDPLPAVLDPGETLDVTVTFTALRAGPQRGAMEVISNVSGSETTRVSLSAQTEPPPISELDVHLVLNWDVDGGSDVDFHFVPTTSDLFSCDDCYFSNMQPDWGVAGAILDDPFLDYDDLEGPGPENINVSELGNGSYLIAVHYYSDTGSGGDGEGGFSTAANATVEVYVGGTLRATYGPTNLSGTDMMWDVAQLDWPSETLTPLGDVYRISRSDHDWCGGLGL